MMTPMEIQALIERHMPGCEASVVSDDNTHFECTVVAEAFAGKRRIQRHQMVYAALGELMGGEIHAMSIRALTPAEAAGGD